MFARAIHIQKQSTSGQKLHQPFALAYQPIFDRLSKFCARRSRPASRGISPFCVLIFEPTGVRCVHLPLSQNYSALDIGKWRFFADKESQLLLCPCSQPLCARPESDVRGPITRHPFQFMSATSIEAAKKSLFPHTLPPTQRRIKNRARRRRVWVCS
jgi:hypothetical protein